MTSDALTPFHLNNAVSTASPGPKPMATQDVERYMFWWPGQAPSYFCGYVRLMELRAETELTLAGAFDRQAFNDFVLSQGVLPPALLRKAVMTEFVPRYK